MGIMKEYLKNSNEFILDGKRYIEKIRKCACYEIRDNEYIFECRIHERGDHSYRYTVGNDFIVRQYNSKKVLYLTDKALNTVKSAIADHEKAVETMKNYSSVSVKNGDRTVVIYYHHTVGDHVEYLLEYDVGEKHGEKIYGRYDSLHRLLCDVADLIAANHEEWSSIIRSSEENIENNPVYKASIDQADKLFTKILKLHYGIADGSECSVLSEIFGLRILPSLSEKYDKDYYVVTDTVDGALLNRSRYNILHRPYFAMKGSTHTIITLNPHTKSGVDAAPVLAEAISFQEFLELFDTDVKT